MRLGLKLWIVFLEWLRGNGSGISTANQRPAALKSFAHYAGIEHIELLAPLQNIQSIKSAKPVTEEIIYLSSEQMALLINRPDINFANGLRHRVILTLLYDSGGRVQELCDLKIRDVDTDAATVHLHGKGNKHRTVAISENTAKLVAEYVKRQRKTDDLSQPLLLNKNRKNICRDGVNYVIRKYAKEVGALETAFPKSIHAHCFRHSKAMHMLAAGIPNKKPPCKKLAGRFSLWGKFNRIKNNGIAYTIFRHPVKPVRSKMLMISGRTFFTVSMLSRSSIYCMTVKNTLSPALEIYSSFSRSSVTVFVPSSAGMSCTSIIGEVWAFICPEIAA